MNPVEKYYKDNKLAVLISKDFGAGWSTWGRPDLAYDKRIIQFYLDNYKNDWTARERDEKWHNFLESIGYHDMYLGGLCDLKLVWIPRGTRFIICENDGFEYIRTIDDLHFIEA